MSPESEEHIESDSVDDHDTSQQTKTTGSKTATKRRTKTGCLTCRKRRIKCGEERPTCKNCVKSKRECAGYNPPQIYRHQSGGLAAFPVQEPGRSGNYDPYEGQFFPTTGHGELPIHHHDYSGGINVNPAQISSSMDAELSNQNARSHAAFADMNFQQSHWYSSNTPNQIDPEYAIGGIDQTNHHPQSIELPFIDTQAAIQPDTQRLVPVSASYFSTESYPSTITPYLRLSHTTPFTHRYGADSFVQHPSLVTQPSSLSDYDLSSSSLSTHHVQSPSAVTTTMPGQADSPGISVIHNGHDLKQSGSNKVLTQTKTSIENSPLLDEKSHRIFQHFLEFTAPCMSIFDHLEDRGPGILPKMVWTHGLPAMAHRHPALAHSILAVGALHLARLNKGSMETSMKHFSLALTRVGKLLGPEDTRHHISTLATVLLLAYYEVMAGDHSRWSLHLSGAARLVMEHNYAGMVRTLRSMRQRATSDLAQPWPRNSPMTATDTIRPAGIPEALLDDNDWNVDESLVASLMGVDIDYDTQVQANFRDTPTASYFTVHEIEDFKILTELYWWYCKQDIFQSMLSGDAPLLPYSKWKFCPPRGPIGDIDRAHASVDHLWLLLARLVAFGARDRVRKQRVVAAQGGEWIPPPGFLPKPPTMVSKVGSQPSASQHTSATNTSTDPEPSHRPEMPPTANEGRARTKPTTSAVPTSLSGPAPMYGMIPPPTRPVRMSSSFEVMDAELQKDANDSPESLQSTDNLECDLGKALAEHASINDAFDVFAAHMGPEFQPLPVDQYLTTPFGPAIRYKTPTIAAMWTFYYVGRILLRRLHPHSPPAAMISAGVNASITREHAQTIGRICGGLYAQYNYLIQAGYTDHIFTAAITETTFSLLFAGVQYNDAAQRSWTISKLSDISQLGWASSAAIASACETMWEKMGMAGKGPPYTRILDYGDSDVRVRRRDADTPLAAHPIPENMGQGDVFKEHESRFVSHDRNLIVRHGSTRAFWALGLLSVEDDLKKMNLNEAGNDCD